MAPLRAASRGTCSRSFSQSASSSTPAGRGLAYVSQAIAARNGIGALHDELHLALDRDVDSSPLHAWLAALPPLLRHKGLPQQLIVSTGLDTGVERAFEAADEELDVVVYVAAGRDRGKFLHISPDGAATVVDEPNAYTGLALDERSVLLKIHGHVDRGATRERESFAVSEDDHIDYLVGDSAGTVPVQLAARLRRSHLLFLGYDVDDWSLRVFLRRVWGSDRLAYRSWAVQRSADHVAGELWRERGAEVYDVSLDTYAGELARLTSALAGRRGADMNLPPSPFKGLAYFGDSEHDWHFFFGRERESEVVAANLMASRLTVLYGPSGVGKSSLLRAGVARRLRTLVPAIGGEDQGAEVAIIDTWRDDPILAVAVAAGAPTDIPLADALAERAISTDSELYLILDQMEEYVLYHGRDGGPLAAALEDVLTRPDLPVHVLLGVRDDSLGDLDAFKRRLPGLFGNLLRLDHLTRAAARSAIEGPLRAYAELGGPAVTAEDELVEAVLEEVAAGRIEQQLSGRGLVDEGRRERRVEAPYLQLVLERLWEVERQSGSDVLRASTLAELGGAERIVEEHLERALAGLDAGERDLVARLFNYLVTPSGTKISHAVDDLARYADEDPSRLEPVLARARCGSHPPPCPRQEWGPAPVRDLPRRSRAGRPRVAHAARG